MNGDAFLTLMMQRLGNRTSATLRAVCLQETELAQGAILERLGGTTPWFLQTEAAVDYVVGVEAIALPTNFLAFNEESGMLLISDPATSTERQLTRRGYVSMQMRFREVTVGMPREFDIVGTNILVRPLPDSNYSGRLVYMGSDAAPTDAAAENLWLKYCPDLLMSVAGERVASLHLQNAQLSSAFSAGIQRGLDGLLRRQTAMEIQIRDLNMGEPR